MALAAAIALFLAFFLVVPVVTVIYVAFTEQGTGAFTLVNFYDFFNNDLFIRSTWNSIWVALMTVAWASAIALPLAYITTRFEFKGALMIQTLGFLPLVMPPFVGAVALQLLFGRNGTFNLLLDEYFGFKIPFMEGLWGVVFVEALHYFPFILVNLSVSLRNIDRSMEEAAQNLGASGFRLFRRIVFPLAMPGYIAGAALVFVKVFDDLATPLLLNVKDMLAPQAYPARHVHRHRRPDGLRHLRRAHRRVGVCGLAVHAVAEREGLRDRAARRRRAVAPQAEAAGIARRLQRRDVPAAAGSRAALRTADPVVRDGVVVQPAAGRFHHRPLRARVRRIPGSTSRTR